MMGMGHVTAGLLLWLDAAEGGVRMDDDTRPFPIQAGVLGESRSSIPWWLAEIAYDSYVKSFGSGQSLQCLLERGGFSRDELVCLIRREFER